MLLFMCKNYLAFSEGIEGPEGFPLVDTDIQDCCFGF